MATGLLVIRLSRPFAAKPAANWVIKRLFRCLCCEDVIKSKLVYTVLMRPKIRPEHVSAVTQRHVKNHLFTLHIIAIIIANIP